MIGVLVEPLMSFKWSQQDPFLQIRQHTHAHRVCAPDTREVTLPRTTTAQGDIRDNLFGLKSQKKLLWACCPKWNLIGGLKRGKEDPDFSCLDKLVHDPWRILAKS